MGRAKDDMTQPIVKNIASSRYGLLAFPVSWEYRLAISVGIGDNK